MYLAKSKHSYLLTLLMLTLLTLTLLAVNKKDMFIYLNDKVMNDGAQVGGLVL